MVEELLQTLVGVVDAQLLERVVLNTTTTPHTTALQQSNCSAFYAIYNTTYSQLSGIAASRSELRNFRKLGIMVFNCLNGQAPPYLVELSQPV